MVPSNNTIILVLFSPVHFQLWVINSLLSFFFFPGLLDYASIVLSFSSNKQKTAGETQDVHFAQSFA
jgi:hypothetical protein